MLLWPFYTCVFHNVSFWEKVSSASQWRCNYKAWPQQKLASRPGALCGGLISLMKPAVFFAGEVTVKPTALNSPTPLLCWYYWRTKNHTATHCIGVYSIMLFTDGCAVLSSWERHAQLQKFKNQYVAATAEYYSLFLNLLKSTKYYDWVTESIPTMF